MTLEGELRALLVHGGGTKADGTPFSTLDFADLPRGLPERTPEECRDRLAWRRQVIGLAERLNMPAHYLEACRAEADGIEARLEELDG